MKSSRFVLIGLAAGLWAGWGEGDAFAQKIYWTDVLYGRIQKADVGCLLGPNPSGCTVTVLDTLTVVPPTATHPGAKSPNSVTVDSINGRIYWSEFWTGVHRTTLDGQSTQTIVPTPPMPIHPSWIPPVFLPGFPPVTPGPAAGPLRTVVNRMSRGDRCGCVACATPNPAPATP